MKHFIKFTKYILAFLILFAPFSVDASCQKIKRCSGSQGPQGIPGPPFITTFGTWYIPGTAGITVDPGQIIPFNTEEISNGIINTSGVFLFSRTGVYQVTLGYAPQEGGDNIAIELNNTVLPGGRIIVPFSSPNVITVMFSAAAGDQLDVRNLSDLTITIGFGDPSPGIYISILQIQ